MYASRSSSSSSRKILRETVFRILRSTSSFIHLYMYVHIRYIYKYIRKKKIYILLTERDACDDRPEEPVVRIRSGDYTSAQRPTRRRGALRREFGRARYRARLIANDGQIARSMAAAIATKTARHQPSRDVLAAGTRKTFASASSVCASCCRWLNGRVDHAERTRARFRVT